ncbi:gas vesicle protein, partial [Halobacteriales archaeon QS_7_68_65]
MEPSKPEEGAVVDLVDAILRDGVVLQADVIISVADVPLIGLKLRAALAGMDTMTEY